MARIGKPARQFVEGLVDDDGARVRTFTRLLSPERGLSLTQGFLRDGFLQAGRLLPDLAQGACLALRALVAQAVVGAFPGRRLE